MTESVNGLGKTTTKRPEVTSGWRWAVFCWRVVLVEGRWGFRGVRAGMSVRVRVGFG